MIPIEEVEITAAGVALSRAPKARGELITPPGRYLRRGERLARAGDVLTPAQVGLFAAGGIETVPVYARPRVAVLPTGDELVAPTDQVPPGKNVDSNSYMIAAYLERWGAQAVRLSIAADDLEGITAALQGALERCDAAVIIAGSSLGTKDFTLRVLDRLGEVLAPELAHGPGRKSSFSLVGGKPVLGVAGPPLGAQIVCDLYLSPLVAALRGTPYCRLRQLEAICDDAFDPHPVDFCERVHIYRGGDGYHIRSAFAPRPPGRRWRPWPTAASTARPTPPAPWAAGRWWSSSAPWRRCRTTTAWRRSWGREDSGTEETAKARGRHTVPCVPAVLPPGGWRRARRAVKASAA